jgi:hypothetical protein
VAAVSGFDEVVGDVPEPGPPRRLPKQNATPGAAAKWHADRRRSGRHALTIARGHADDSSPYRMIVRSVDVDTRPVPRAGIVVEKRLELECGHVVPLPGRAIPDTEPRQMRRCRPCADGQPRRR